MNCPHCETEVDEHPAGRCLDAWVAEVVFGSPPTRDDWEYCLWNTDCQLSEGNCFFSTEIAAAWKVVESLCANSYVDIGVDEHGAQVQLDILQDGKWETGESTRANTAPLAICRAALKAVGE